MQNEKLKHLPVHGMTISITDVQKLKLKGKPKCPACNPPLTFIYEGSTGYSGVKCKRCGQEFLINTETLEVLRISKAG